MIKSELLLMAEDFHEKTEEPTPKKLADARKKGFVAKSNDMTIAFMLMGTMIVFFFFAPYMVRNIAKLSVLVFKNINYDFVDIKVISYFLNGALEELFWIFLPLLAGVIFMGIVLNLLQSGLIFTAYPMKPKWKKLNVFDPYNYQRNFGIPALVRLLFGLVRLNIVMALSWIIISHDAFVIFNMGKGTPRDIAEFIYDKSIVVGLAVALGYIVIGILDFLYQKWRFLRQMRMSRREVKDELKQIEGDLTVKNKIREMMQTFAGHSLAAGVPKADVIISDADNYVVALLYRQGKMKAPICLCKGTRKRGKVILDLARKYQVPVVQRPLLAKSLFRDIDSGDYVTPQYYRDLANILSQLEEK